MTANSSSVVGDALPTEVSVFRPSEYTAALIQVLRTKPEQIRGAAVLELGSGSGVVLAALAALGAGSLFGVDIEESAIKASATLLGTLGHAEMAELRHGDMWAPIGSRRFDLIVANLPHFPMEPAEVNARLPNWSSGGANGRTLLDRLLVGLRHHLSPSGRAFITHNAFVDLDQSRALAEQSGLTLRIVTTVMVHIPSDKFRRITPGVLCAEVGRSIYQYGHYAFADMHIVEIGSPASFR